MGVSQEMVVSTNPATSLSPASVCCFDSLCGDCSLRAHLEGGWRAGGRQANRVLFPSSQRCCLQSNQTGNEVDLWESLYA